MVLRIVLTCVLVSVFAVISNMGNAARTIALGNVAGLQMEPSNLDYIAFSGAVPFINQFGGLIDLALFAIIGLIWIPFVIKNIKSVA